MPEQQGTDEVVPDTSHDIVAATVSRIAMAILQEQYEKGYEIHIPSLGIVIKKDDDHEQSTTTGQE